MSQQKLLDDLDKLKEENKRLREIADTAREYFNTISIHVLNELSRKIRELDKDEEQLLLQDWKDAANNVARNFTIRREEDNIIINEYKQAREAYENYDR